MPPRLRFDIPTSLLLGMCRVSFLSSPPPPSSLPRLSILHPPAVTTTTTTTVTATPSLKRFASGISKQLRARGGGGGAIKRDARHQIKKKKEPRKAYRCLDIRDAEQYPLVEAMRYFRAFEVGRDPKSAKYELHVKLKTPISGATVKNNIRLPHTVKTNMKICVFAEGAQAKAAKEAGAYLVGTDDLWKQIKEGRKDFNRCIAHKSVVQAMNRSQIGRILGPRGLMPSEKTGTVLPDVAGAVQLMLGTEIYRERVGVVRIAIGQLGFTHQQLADNIKAFVAQLKNDLTRLDNTEKSIHEIVLSSTHGPGISLSGEFQAAKTPAKAAVKVARPRRLGSEQAAKRTAERAAMRAPLKKEPVKQAIPA